MVFEQILLKTIWKYKEFDCPFRKHNVLAKLTFDLSYDLLPLTSRINSSLIINLGIICKILIPYLSQLFNNFKRYYMRKMGYRFIFLRSYEQGFVKTLSMSGYMALLAQYSTLNHKYIEFGIKNEHQFEATKT